MNEQKAPAGIEWTRVWGRRGFTWNYVQGCKFGCRWEMPDGTVAKCYAEEIATNLRSDKFFPNGFDQVTFNPDRLNEPLRMKEPAGIFLDSMSDLMGHWVDDEHIYRVLEVCRKASQHIFFLLTKNAPRLLQFDFPENVWTGVSAPPSIIMGKTLKPVQQAAMLGSTLKILARVKSSVKWMSIEPLSFDAAPLYRASGTRLDWAVIGAASNGKKTYQPEPVWVENLLTMFDEQKTPVFFKGNLKGNPAAAKWREDFPAQKVA